MRRNLLPNLDHLSTVALPSIVSPLITRVKSLPIKAFSASDGVLLTRVGIYFLPLPHLRWTVGDRALN